MPKSTASVAFAPQDSVVQDMKVPWMFFSMADRLNLGGNPTGAVNWANGSENGIAVATADLINSTVTTQWTANEGVWTGLSVDDDHCFTIQGSAADIASLYPRRGVTLIWAKILTDNTGPSSSCIMSLGLPTATGTSGFRFLYNPGNARLRLYVAGVDSDAEYMNGTSSSVSNATEYNVACVINNISGEDTVQFYLDGAAEGSPDAMTTPGSIEEDSGLAATRWFAIANGMSTVASLSNSYKGEISRVGIVRYSQMPDRMDEIVARLHYNGSWPVPLMAQYI